VFYLEADALFQLYFYCYGSVYEKCEVTNYQGYWVPENLASKIHAAMLLRAQTCENRPLALRPIRLVTPPPRKCGGGD
jgi:hypothetical protein